MYADNCPMCCLFNNRSSANNLHRIFEISISREISVFYSGYVSIKNRLSIEKRRSGE